MFAFTETKVASAADQHRIIRHWQRFLRTLANFYSDKERLQHAFTELLYSHLRECCSFFPRWGREDFFAHFFMAPAATRRFLYQFDSSRNPEGKSAELDIMHWLYAESRNVNESMRKSLKPQMAKRIEEELQAAEATAQ